jgi:guanylate kinase
MFVVSSPSGAGKTTLSKRLISDVSGVELSVSATTRSMRPGEVDGVDYHFMSRSSFIRRRDEGGFIEWAEVFDHLYGTPLAEVEARLSAGADVVFDVDWQGARALKAARPGDVVSVFILPPSIRELKARLEGRSGGDPETVARRLAGAAEDLKRWGEYDFAIVNDDVQRAFQELSGILFSERVRRARGGLGDFVDELLHQTGSFDGSRP